MFGRLSQTVALVALAAALIISTGCGATGGNSTNHPSVGTGGSGGATGQITGSYNGRNYNGYVPSGYNDIAPMPVVVLLHPDAYTYTNFHTTSLTNGWQSAADQEGFIILTPDNTYAGGNSFKHKDTGGAWDRPATIADLQDLLEAIYYGLGADYNVETTELYLVGFGSSTQVIDYVLWSEMSGQWAGFAGYSSGFTGKNSFPVTRQVPVFYQAGLDAAQLNTTQTAWEQWTAAGHQGNSNWVTGVGHNWPQLNQQGTPPVDVYRWLMTAALSASPVESQFVPGGGNNPPPPPPPPPGGDDGSNGSGGAYPGNVSRTVSVNGLGNQTVRIYVPNSYDPGTPMPMIICLHGQAGDGNAPTAANQVRQIWSSVAEANDFIIVAQEGTSQGGSYIANNAAAVMNAIIDDMYAAYNIGTKRVFTWGFSAGGHVVHAIALSNANFFAGYGTSAGVLGGAALQMGISPSTADRQIPYIASIGTSDPLHPNALQDRTAFLNAGWTENTNYKLSEFNGGHTFTSGHCQTIWTFLKDHTAP